MTGDTMEVRFSDTRRTYIYEHPAILTIALFAAVGGLLFLAVPDVLSRSSLGSTMPYGLERAWAIAYSIGGTLILIGACRLDARHEMLGLMLLAGCYVAYSIAVISWRGVVDGVVAASVITALGVGCALRAYTLRYEPEHAPWRRRARH